MPTEQVKIKHSSVYALAGFTFGIFAPIAWTVIRLLLFPQAGVPLFTQIFSDITKSSYNIALYLFMGLGTACVMSLLGYFIGKGTDDLNERASELDVLHREVASQKEVFENRYKVLDNNIKNFHHISNRIQKTIDRNEVLSLCAEGLHEVLGYERVNILVADDTRSHLQFAASTGSSDYNIHGVKIPLDPRSGVIYKCFQEKRLYFIDDIGKFPADYHLQPPYDGIKPLRSRSFVLCPIIVKGESVGVFGIDNRFSHRSLNDTDVDTVKLFADQAASAITKINLLNAIDTLTTELEDSFSSLLQNRENYSRNVYNLRVSVETVADGTARIVTASESVLNSVDETSSAVSEISVSIDQVTQNLDFLAESIDRTVTAMEEMGESIKNVETNAAVSHDISTDVKARADKGKEVVDETMQALGAIQRSVDLLYDGIRRLTDNSGRIDSIIGVINNITRRTNLLALNASIIAAQAGEFGKSFGVVADEIRNLSLQTGQSTGEITEIINEILSESNHASANVTGTKELVSRGVELGRDLVEAFDVIQNGSAQSMNMTHEIKTATKEQSNGVTYIARNIEDVSTMTSQIFNSSKEQNNAVKNIVRAVESIKELAQEMVAVTGRQADGDMAIRHSLESVSRMVAEIFDSMEERRVQSLEVVKELELLKETSA